MLNKWDNRFVSITNEVASWSSCLHRNVGAVIVKDNRIISTGYNGAPKDVVSCKDKNKCERENIESGTHAEFCKGVHAEQNAIIQCARLGISCENATLYCTHKPCVICAKIIINAGIKRIVYWNDYPDKLSDKILKESNVIVEKINI